MDVVEAFETLGLDESDELSAEQLKRSYLRKVRQHPPERDPAGFQQVRQAYELLQQRSNGRAELSAHVARPEPFSAPAPDRTSEPPRASSADAPKPSAEPSIPQPEPAQSRTPDPPAPAASDALTRLRSAVGESKWVAAGNALLELYADATLSERLPPPEIALRISLELFESGKHKTARRLFEAFKAHMASHGTRLSAETASVWKLLSELSELSRAVDSSLTCALAEAIRSGAFQDAAPELRAEMAQYGDRKVTALMQSRAPTLLAATWPYVRPPAQRSKRTWRGLPWVARLSLFGIFGLYRLVVSLTESPTHSDYVVPAAVVDRPRPDRRFSEPSSVLSASDTLKLHDITSKIEKLYQSGQCDETRAAWDEYLVVARPLGGAPAVRQGYAFRRTQAISTCPTLATELPEEP